MPTSQRAKSFAQFVSVFIIFQFLSAALFANNKSLIFEKLSIEQGLSQTTINSILQDSRGFIWFATQDGLNRYDGYSFTIYKKKFNDSNSLSENWLTVLKEDNKGNIWIGTAGGGLNKFDLKTKEFSVFRSNEDRNSLNNDHIKSIFIDKKNVLWIGTAGNGLIRFDPEKNNFFQIHYKSTTDENININDVIDIAQDQNELLWFMSSDNNLFTYNQTNKKTSFIKSFKLDDDSNTKASKMIVDVFGEVWVGTAGKGIAIFNSESKATRHFTTANSKLVNNHINSITEDSEKNIWIGTGSGLSIYNQKEKSFSNIVHDPLRTTSLSENLIFSIYEDNAGIMWIGTKGNGINKLNKQKSVFQNYKSLVKSKNSLLDNSIWSFEEDHKRTIWIGTNKGLNAFDPSSEKFTRFSFKSEVRALKEDRNGNLWIGTNGSGLKKFNSNRTSIQHFNHNSDSNSLSNNQIRVIFEDKESRLWIGTWDGLNLYDKNKNRFISYKHIDGDGQSLPDNRIRSLYEDTKGNFWVGTYNGLALLDRNTGKSITFKPDEQNPNSISHNRILSIFESESDSTLWIGTFSGLNKYNPENSTFSHYTIENGLPNDVIYGIIEDNSGYLWLSTNLGLAKFDPIKEEFKNFNIQDGLQSNEFNGGAYLKTLSGELYFGGINGFNRFSPSRIRVNKNIPKIQLTSFTKFGKAVNLENAIEESKEIQLSYKDNYFSFEFAALDYSNPGKNQYAYKLEGFDEEWIESDTRRYASYTNLEAGEYTFLVKGSNNDGIWNNEGVALDIIITPPYWSTWWFRLTVSVLLAISVYTIYKRRSNRFKRQKAELKKKVREKTTELISQNLKLQNAQNETNKITTQISLLYKVSQKISSELDLDKLLNDIVHSAQSEFNYYGVMLLITNKTGNQLNLKSIAGGYENEYPSDLMVEFGKGMIGKAATTKKIQLSNNVEDCSDYIRNENDLTKAELAVPLISGNKVIGVLDIQSGESETFENSDISAMETFATQITAAIENARLYRQTQISHDELSEAKKETDNILNNVDQGFFLVNKECEIGSQYSKSLETIFSKTQLAHNSFLDILAGKIPQHLFTNIQEYLELMFRDDIEEETINNLNPLSDIQLNFSKTDTVLTQSKHLSFKFKRIADQSDETKQLIVTVRDITDRIELSKKLEKQEDQTKKQMEWLINILHIAPELLREFIDEANTVIDVVENQIRQINPNGDFKKDLQKIYKNIHFISDKSEQIELRYIAHHITEFEEKIDAFKQKEQISGMDFVPLIIDLGKIKTTIKELDKLINKIGKFHSGFSKSEKEQPALEVN
ncbi:MAG: GAF domain-containing protein [Calditrichaeota bacterium]|nr:MAG: GAF domain-containing protein [Calditrichota bacterium]MBL1206125.1 GAF domain-containing protein [Calditrichota bacterium]NOG45950.1 GAF domain-containing protein [Calditrichota bacterium]